MQTKRFAPTVYQVFDLVSRTVRGEYVDFRRAQMNANAANDTFGGAVFYVVRHAK